MDIITNKPMVYSSKTLGIELIGSVFEIPKIIKKRNNGKSKQIATLVENSIETINKIISEFFQERVILFISGDVTIQDIVLRSLREHNFYRLTGTNNTQFQVLQDERSKFKYLTPSYIKINGETIVQNTHTQITHIIDPKINPLAELNNIPYRFLFRPEMADATEHKVHQKSIHLIYSWESIYHMIREEYQSTYYQQEECEKNNIFLGAAS